MNIKIVIPIQPRTKKNSQQICWIKRPMKIMGRYSIPYTPIIIPSKLYKEYEKDCKPFIPKIDKPINESVNMKCLYYMPTRRKCDLNNLLEATTDMLVHYGVVEDDNYTIVSSHDGSRVYYDKENPRTEIYITSQE